MAPQRALHNRIWEHKSSTILFSSVQNNSTDRVRCHPWSALIFWNAKIKQYAWPPFDLPHGSNTSFSIIYQKIITFHPAEFFLFFYFWSFLAKMAWNAIVCETTDVSRETATLPIFQKTWFQAILAKKKRKKKTYKKKQKKRENRLVRKILWSAKILQSAWILQYVYVPSCGVRCPRWSAKNLWNAKNSEYAWLVQRPHREISGPEPKFQSQSQPKLPGAGPVGSIFPISPWVRSRGRNLLIFTQPTFENVTFDNPVLLR